MDFKMIHIDETDSTNRWLRCHSGVRTCVVAEYQTAGKGCGKNSWESERGKNLTFSVMVHPTDIPASRQFLISEIVSVALCETLDPYAGQQLQIKWPNDIYHGDRKLCGILIENRLQGNTIKDSIIGIGLNVNQETFLSDAPNPVSLCQIVGHDIDRDALLRDFLEHLAAAFTREDIPSVYRRLLYRKEGFHAYEDAKGRFLAKVHDVCDDGHLVLLDTEGTLRTYAFKEVQFVIKD